MKCSRGFLLFLITAWLGGCAEPLADAGEPTRPTVYPGHELVWHDEFDGTTLDPTKWSYETGTGVNGDFGTGQVDRATDRPENVAIRRDVADAADGSLAITLRQEHYVDRAYTSGRIHTKEKAAWGPGHRIEARIWAEGIRYKGQGFAFWMMPAEVPEGQPGLMWPQGGEIDVMEYVGAIPYHNLGSVHYAFAWNNNQWAAWNHGHQGGYYAYASGQVPAQNPGYGLYPPAAGDPDTGSGAFHLYGIDWYADRLEFYVDHQVYHVHYFADGAAASADGQDHGAVQLLDGRRVFISEYANHFAQWHPFAHRFYLILSAGVGGADDRSYGGRIVPAAVFPAAVFVDWVRVYRRTS